MLKYFCTVALPLFASLADFVSGLPSAVATCDPAQSLCNALTTVASGNVAAINAIPLANNCTASITIDGVGPILIPTQAGVLATDQAFGLVMIKAQNLECTSHAPLQGDATFVANFGIRATGTVLATANIHVHSLVDQACELVQGHADIDSIRPTLA